jgi:rod shape-determining protein MreC
VAKLRLDKFRPLLALGIFLLSWWVLPSFIKSFLRTSFAEFQAPAWVASAQLDRLEDFWARRSHSKIELINAGKELARQKAYYQALAQRHEVLEDEIDRLGAILSLPTQREYRHEVARVIRRDLSAWWQQMIIRKGRDYQIPEGAAVIFAGGVVGRVAEVRAFTSRIELISSPNFRMAATFEKDARPVVYQGVAQNGFGPPHGEVRDAPQDLLANSQAPLKLISTRLGGTFPAGLTIGTVNWLEPGSSGIFQTGKVHLDKRLLSLEEVTVLIPLNPVDYSHDAD